MRSKDELVIITKTYDLILWSYQHTSRFPRNHRFVLGERIERNLYDLLETLIQAKYQKEHFVKDRLRAPGYVRYVDDFLVFADDKQTLHDIQAAVANFLVDFRLRLHTRKNVIFPVRDGICFLVGQRHFGFITPLK